jgi:hypothetical protein
VLTDYNNKILINMDYKKLIEELVLELSYRVGIPDLKNKEHQSIMSEILTEWGEIEAKYIIMDFLNEEKSPEDEKYSSIGYGYFVKKGEEEKEDAQKFKKDDSGKYIPIAQDKYDSDKQKQGDAGEKAAEPQNKSKEKDGGEGADAKPEEPTSNIFDKETLDRYKDEETGGDGESTTDTINTAISAFQSDTDNIISGKKNPPGTGGSAVGEMYGGISLKELHANSELSEKEFVDSKFEEVRNSPISEGMSDNDIKKWLKVSYRTGKSELKELSTNPKYRWKSPQTQPFPIPVMDPVNEKGSAKKELLKLMEAKLKEAQESGDESAVKHYERQIRFIGKRKDTDSGILYETSEGFVGFKHTSNKKSFSDTVFNSTIRVRGAIMAESSNLISSKYELNELEAKKITDNIENISKKAVSIIEQASLGPSGTINANVSDTLEFTQKNKVGKLFRNFDGGQSGRKDYLAELQSDMESNKGLGKKVNKYLSDKGLQPPYTDDQIAGAVMGLSKDGDMTGDVTKLVTKLSDNVAKVREIQKSLRKKYPNKSEEELLQLTKEQINKYKTKNAVPFEDGDIKVMLSPEMDWIETTSASMKDAMKVAYNQISTEIADADERWQRENSPKDPQPPINGPHTQAYVNSYMKQMHWDRYILGEEEDIGDMNIEGYTVNSQHIRTCLSSLSDYKGDLSTKEGKEGLMEHLRKTMKINNDDESLVFQSETGTSQIGKEQYRTKGVGNNSLLGNFGKDMQKCLKEQVSQ